MVQSYLEDSTNVDAAYGHREWEDVYYTSRDDLRLHVRHYPAPNSTRRPVICLPGLTRNAAEFHSLALALSHPEGPHRPVYSVDYRGRGLSDHDRDWRNYTPYIECLDVLDFMAVRGIHSAAMIGSSRGGMIAMIMAALRPTAIACAVLNDIGPVIEPDGLARIVGYVGKVPLPVTWDDAVKLTREMNVEHFTDLTPTDWDRFTRTLYIDQHDTPASAYDRNLAKSISSVDLSGTPPKMWPQFIALGRLPVMGIRGEHSDILSQATFERMAALHPNFTSHVVPGQGHTPLLTDRPTQTQIVRFLLQADTRERATRAKASPVATADTLG